MKKEITLELKLNNEEQNLLEMHSFLNVLNVLTAELTLLGMHYDKEQELESVINYCIEAARSLHDKEKAIDTAKNIEKMESMILSEVNKHLSIHSDIKNDKYFNDSLQNITSIFRIINVRVRELLARINDPQKWEVHNLSNLKDNFVNVFNAIEKNSKGRYRIIYNIAEHDEKDYLVNLNFRSIDGKSIKMPPVFQDVMRDLVANARKYTPPGGKIDAGLYDDGKTLKFAVQDTGKGIPENEIETVINFGFRAGNVSDIRTRGGGFGLTKAYFITKQFNGRMWIESIVGEGTKITIHIPRNY